MVILGPSFLPPVVTEASLLSWDPATVLSLGKNYSILLSTGSRGVDVVGGQTRTPVHLAIAGESIFICANGGLSSKIIHFPCFC